MAAGLHRLRHTSDNQAERLSGFCLNRRSLRNSGAKSAPFGQTMVSGSRRPAYLEKIIELVDTQNPDILVITGDLLDRNVLAVDLESLAELVYPVFYCSGNHERYVDYKRALDNIAKQGITVLSDSVTTCLGLRLLGIEDRQNVSDAENALDKLQVSEMADITPFSVLLYHQPDLWDCAKRHSIDLTLSGHTHKGQIWPFGLAVRTRYRYVAGLFKSASSHLLVSQGAGTWGPIMRFGTRCEITVLDLKGDDLTDHRML